MMKHLSLYRSESAALVWLETVFLIKKWTDIYRTHIYAQ